MSKCTKGPWTAVQDNGECWQVLPVMQEDGFAGGYRWVSEADARLIAAAPDLRDALVLAQKWLANCVPVARMDGPTPLPVIAAALAKAEPPK